MPIVRTHQGDSVWSESESAAVRDFLAVGGPVRQDNELMGGLDLHSFGQMFNRERQPVSPSVIEWDPTRLSFTACRAGLRSLRLDRPGHSSPTQRCRNHSMR